MQGRFSSKSYPSGLWNKELVVYSAILPITRSPLLRTLCLSPVLSVTYLLTPFPRTRISVCRVSTSLECENTTRKGYRPRENQAAQLHSRSVSSSRTHIMGHIVICHQIFLKSYKESPSPICLLSINSKQKSRWLKRNGYDFCSGPFAAPLINR